MLRVLIARSKHHQRRPPPAIQRILRHGFLRIRATAQLEHDLEALPLVKTLFLAHPNHRPRIRPVGATTQRNLIHDRRAVDQPTHRADVGPGQGWVVEDARVFRFAGQQIRDHLIARYAQRFRGAVQIQSVARLVLHFGKQNGFAF